MSRKKKKKPQSNSELLQYYLYQGAEILEPRYLKRWQQIVETRLNDLFFGKELDDALELAQILNQSDQNSYTKLYAAVQKVHQQEHNEFSARLTLTILVRICTLGRDLESQFYPPY